MLDDEGHVAREIGVDHQPQPQPQRGIGHRLPAEFALRDPRRRAVQHRKRQDQHEAVIQPGIGEGQQHQPAVALREQQVQRHQQQQQGRALRADHQHPGEERGRKPEHAQRPQRRVTDSQPPQQRPGQHHHPRRDGDHTRLRPGHAAPGGPGREVGVKEQVVIDVTIRAEQRLWQPHEVQRQPSLAHDLGRGAGVVVVIGPHKARLGEQDDAEDRGAEAEDQQGGEGSGQGFERVHPGVSLR